MQSGLYFKYIRDKLRPISRPTTRPDRGLALHKNRDGHDEVNNEEQENEVNPGVAELTLINDAAYLKEDVVADNLSDDKEMSNDESNGEDVIEDRETEVLNPEGDEIDDNLNDDQPSKAKTSSIHVKKKKNQCGKYFGWIRYTTVEPTMWLYMMTCMTTAVIEQGLFVHKSCRVDHGLSEEVCNNLAENATLQAQVQVTVSNFHQWNDIASHAFPIILALFFGSWSDRRGRKAPLLIALFGKFIYYWMVVVNTLVDTWKLNMIVYTASLPMSLLGGELAIFASCCSYICDVSSSKERTFRVFVLDVIFLSTMPTGIALGSYLFSSVLNSSYTMMFAINGSLLLLALIYSVMRLEMRTTPQQMPFANGTNLIIDFFDKDHVIASVKTLTRPRPAHRRLYLWILLLSMGLYNFLRNEKGMGYLYTQLMFSWDVRMFSNFRTFQTTVLVIAMLFGVPLMNKLLGMRDTLIIAVAALSNAAGRIIEATKSSPDYFYVGIVVAALGPIVPTVLRSMSSKVVPLRERGKVFALLTVCDSASPLISGPLYTQLYNATLTTVPSAIYWLTFSTQIAVLLLIMVIHVTLGSRQLEAESEENGDPCPPEPSKINPSPILESDNVVPA